MPKFVASGKFSPSSIDTLIAKRGGGFVKASALFDANRVVSSDADTVAALEDAFATDATLDDPTATMFGVRVRTPQGAANVMRPLTYLSLQETTGALTDQGTANAGAGITIGANITRTSTNLTPAWAGRTSFNHSTISNTNGLDFGNDTRYSFAGTSSHSAAMWIRPSAITTTHTLIGKYDGGATDGWRLFISATGALTYTRGLTGTGSNGATAGSVIAAGTTYHVGFSYDGVLNRSRIFVNGILVKTTIHTTVPSSGSNAVPFRIGQRSDSATLGFVGDYSDVVVCNYAVPDHWFRALWAAGQYTDA